MPGNWIDSLKCTTERLWCDYNANQSMTNCSTVPLTTEIALSDRARYSEQRLYLLLLMSVHSVTPGWLIITDVNRARASGLKLLARNTSLPLLILHFPLGGKSTRCVRNVHRVIKYCRAECAQWIATASRCGGNSIHLPTQCIQWMDEWMVQTHGWCERMSTFIGSY